MTFTEDLCRRHATWAVDRTGIAELPDGWHALVSDSFDGLASLMAGHPDRKLHILQVKEKFGGLRFCWRLDTMTSDADALLSDAVRDLVAVAEATSFTVCDVCGGSGLLRCDAGTLATRCDEHAPPGADPVDWIGADGEHAPLAPRNGAPRPGDEGAEGRERPGWTDAGEARQGPRPAERDGAEDPARRQDAGRDPPWCIPLYALDDVAAALGRKRGDAAELDCYEDDPDLVEPPAARRYDNEHQARLQEILAAGPEGRWRDLAEVPPGALEALDDLGRRAPHLDAVTDLVRRQLRASLAIGLPVALPPLLLVGAPGVGKTWYLSRLAGVLGVPFRSYPFNISTLGEGLSGSHPSWRNAGPGLVAKTLLRERLANPLLFCDEIDKPVQNGWNRDPYGPLYTLLDRSGSKEFADEFLQFAMDASRVCWVMSGNTTDPLPDPIVDRLTVLTVPGMSATQVAAVTMSIYAEANAARRGYFAPEPGPDVVDGLLDLNPRSIRVVLEDAMVTAAAAGRRALAADDLRPRGRRTYRIGFRA